MSKKMKGVAFEGARATFKHQTLLQDYIELQQETVAARNKLEAMKQKKQTLEEEVRFLRRRHKFLLKTKSSAPKEGKSLNVETTHLKKSKKENKKAATLRNLPPIPNLNQKGRVYTEKKRGPPPVFDMGRTVNSHGFNPNRRTDLDQKESGSMMGKEAVVQPRAPIFDLNQISIEEEEEEEENDMKLSVCRNVGDGSNRSGKRRISWQDPVALRV